VLIPLLYHSNNDKQGILILSFSSGTPNKKVFRYFLIDRKMERSEKLLPKGVKGKIPLASGMCGGLPHIHCLRVQFHPHVNDYSKKIMPQN